MSIWTDAVPFFRTQFDAAMVDTCTVAAVTDRGTFNPATGRYSSPSGSDIYSGQCLIRPDQTFEDRERADAEVVVGRYTIIVPHDTVGIQPDDQVTVDTCTLDPGLVGEILTIREVGYDSHIARRVLSCELNLGRGRP